MWLAKKLAPKSEQEVAAEGAAQNEQQAKFEAYQQKNRLDSNHDSDWELGSIGGKLSDAWHRAGDGLNSSVDGWLRAGDADTRIGGGMGGNPLYRGSPSVPVNGQVSQYDSGVATVINNSVVVQGNADASVTRDMVERMGSTTVQSLGRDRSAIGAGVGLRQ